MPIGSHFTPAPGIDRGKYRYRNRVPNGITETRKITEMTTQIWIEPVKRADGRKHYTSEKGLLLMARLGGPDSEILVQGVHNAICEACRVLMSRGIIGSFETRTPGIDYPSVTGDIEKMAGLTVYEPDDGVVHFARWRPFGQDAVSLSAVPLPARAEDGWVGS
jgi:hypothetical protein